VVVALNGILMKMFIDTMNKSNHLASEETDRVLLELTRLVEMPLPYWMDGIYAELPREVQERIHWVAVEETELCREKLLGGWVNAHVKATYQGLCDVFGLLVVVVYCCCMFCCLFVCCLFCWCPLDLIFVILIIVISCSLY